MRKDWGSLNRVREVQSYRHVHQLLLTVLEKEVKAGSYPHKNLFFRDLILPYRVLSLLKIHGWDSELYLISRAYSKKIVGLINILK